MKLSQWFMVLGLILTQCQSAQHLDGDLDGWDDFRMDIESVETEEVGTEDDDEAARMAAPSLGGLIPIRLVFGSRRPVEEGKKTCAIWDFTVLTSDSGTLVHRKNYFLEESDEIIQVGNSLVAKTRTSGGRDGVKFFASRDISLSISGSVKSVVINIEEKCNAEALEKSVTEELNFELVSALEPRTWYPKRLENGLGMLARSGPVRRHISIPAH